MSYFSLDQSGELKTASLWSLLSSRKEKKLIDAVVGAIVVVPQSTLYCFCSNSNGYGRYDTHNGMTSSTESQEKWILAKLQRQKPGNILPGPLNHYTALNHSDTL